MAALTRILLATLMLLGVPTGFALAQDMQSHRTIFKVRFGPLAIGEAVFDIDFNTERYELELNGKTVGIASALAPGTGEARSGGTITEEGVRTDAHYAMYFDKRKEERSELEMDFDAGDVRSVRVEPDERDAKDGPKWVQIAPEHLQSVLDPASTIVIPVELARANDPRTVCNRRFPVYDGDTRFDIELRYKSTKPVTTQGYKGYAFVCQLRYHPVSGHKRGERNIRYMQENEDMEIWLAPMARTNFYTPIRVEVPTWIGNFSAVPEYFGKRPE